MKVYVKLSHLPLNTVVYSVLYLVLLRRFGLCVVFCMTTKKNLKISKKINTMYNLAVLSLSYNTPITKNNSCFITQ